MSPSKECDEDSASTLVLVQDAEYELHASRGSITFPQWGSAEAKGPRRVISFSISLLPRSLEVPPTASIPLVITAPFTPRFRLLSGESSLLPLLRVGSPLVFETEFVAPCGGDDCDSPWANFQDQIVIQTRLARLSVRLSALRDDASTSKVAPESFQPRSLPTVKAPSFKLFDQIERDGAAVAMPPASTSHRVNISASFHPQRNSDRMNSLAPLPPRQPTPPQPNTNISRPSSSGHKRTPSPRVLEPLATALAAPTIISAGVDNQAEAREVILRLRARRSALNSTTNKPSEKNELQPTCPESQLDAKAKAELEDFNALVRTAKMSVAGDMSKAKQELDFYKSLLRGQPSTTNTGQLLCPLPEPQVVRTVSQTVLSKKPARLPAMPQEGERSSEVNQLGGTTNQEASPVKRRSPSASVPVEKTTTKPTPEPPQRRMQTPLTTNRRPQVTQQTAPVPKAQSSGTKALASSKQRPSKSSPLKVSKPSTKPTAASTKTKEKATKKVTVVLPHDDALEDFDDVDPEIDDAPVLPDNVRDDNDLDDPMLTMNVPLY